MATAARARRADALRNQEAVVRAAEEVFAEKGLEAGIPEIAARAGVGKATVYRSFPTKEHLVAAVARERLRWVTELAGAALEDDDAGPAFERVVVALAERQASDRAVAGSLAAAIAHLEEERAMAGATIEALMERARASGAVREDATVDEFRVLFAGVAAVLRERDTRDPTVWRRYALLIMDALRTR